MRESFNIPTIFLIFKEPWMYSLKRREEKKKKKRLDMDR